MYGQYGGGLHDVQDDDGLDGEGEGVDGGCLDRGPQEADCPKPHQLTIGPPTTAETFAYDFNLFTQNMRERNSGQPLSLFYGS